MIDLSGKTALVTGASRGIGAATARLLARCGADVVVAYRARAADAAAVVLELEAMGRRATAVAADLGDRGEAERLVQQSVAFLGGLDVFVGNAGIWPPDDIPLAHMTEAHWRRTMRENVDAMFFSTAAAARALRDDGRIVLVSSTAGQRGEAGHADYAASKGAMISFVKSLCVELAPRGITVNSVAPGWVETEMSAPALTPEVRARAERSIPIGRIASPDDVAGPIAFLCSSLARHVTGEILNVNGGSVLAG
jgi:3-oxoacyl-[acyl-carrier protein] reductase